MCMVRACVFSACAFVFRQSVCMCVPECMCVDVCVWMDVQYIRVWRCVPEYAHVHDVVLYYLEGIVVMNL